MENIGGYKYYLYMNLNFILEYRNYCIMHFIIMWICITGSVAVV